MSQYFEIIFVCNINYAHTRLYQRRCSNCSFFSIVSCGLREEIVYEDINLKENYSF